MWTLNQFCVVTGDFPDFCFSVQCCVTPQRVLCSSSGCTYHELWRRAQEGWVRERNPWNCWFMVTGCRGASRKAVPKSRKLFQLALRALSKAQNDYQGIQQRLFACWIWKKMMVVQANPCVFPGNSSLSYSLLSHNSLSYDWKGKISQKERTLIKFG